MTSKLFSTALVLFMGSAALAAVGSDQRVPCAIQPKKGTPKSELAGMAKVSQAEAQKTAIDSVKSDNAEVAEAELEVENDCLVYSFDIKIAGKSGVQEVMVDAGNGKVLSSKHESPKAEANERAKEKAPKKD